MARGCPPDKPFSNGKTNQGKLYIIFEGNYQRFRISLNKRKITEFPDFANDFASWFITDDDF